MINELIKITTETFWLFAAGEIGDELEAIIDLENNHGDGI